MFEAGYCIIHMALATVTVWITWKYLSVFFKPQKPQTIIILLWSLFYIYQVWIEGQKNIGFLWILIINITIQFLIAVVGYEGSLKKKLFHIVLLFIVWTLIEMVVYFILKLIPLKNQEFSILGSVISKLTAVMLIHILQLWLQKKHSESISLYYMTVLFLFPLSSMFIAHNIFVMDCERGLNLLTFISYSLLLISNLFIFEIYYKLSMNYTLEKENSMFQQQIELLTVHSEEQQRSHEEIARMRHDMKNQLLVLRHEVVNRDIDSATQTIDDMLHATRQEDKGLIQSGNDLVDVILNSKYSIAEKENICFKWKIFIPNTLPIQQGDIGILLGNALDNAIEAVKQCQSNKQIEISMGIKKSSLVIVIKNPFETEPIMDMYGQYQTTKKHKENHGYGLKSIQRIVEKYNGDLNISVNNKNFSLIAILNIWKKDIS